MAGLRGRDRSWARLRVGGGFPLPPFRLRVGITIPPCATVPKASLRSRTVGFPESGSDLGFPSRAFPTVAKLKCWPTYAPALAGLPTSSPSLRGSAYPGSVSGRRPGAAKCPEPLCPGKELPCRGRPREPPGRELPLRLRSYGLMRRTKSLPPISGTALYGGSLQVVASPCWELAFPDVISASLSLDARTSVTAGRAVLLPVASQHDFGLPQGEMGRLSRIVPLSDFRAGVVFATAVIPLCSGLQVCLPPRPLPSLRHRRRTAVASTSEQNMCRCLHMHRIC
jgi:hypothetical protein